MTAAKIQILPLRKPSTSPSSSEDSPPDQSNDGTRAPSKPVEKKTRTSKPKVRSGCVTCKIRRIKCDETKPECNKCTSTGRKCDGYAIKPRKKRSPPALPRGLDLTTDIGPAELRSLGFFHHKTAPSLSSYFDADFWTRLVFQMSYIEPSVRHAMVALGALHEQREDSVRMMPLTVADPDCDPVVRYSRKNNDEFALAQYTKAITHLSKRMNSDSSIEVALLACILFVCIEFLRGDTNPALEHFKGGMNIAISSALSKNTSTTTHATVERIKNHMLPFLNRIELLTALFGNEASWDYPVELLQAVPDEFMNIREARDSMVHLANHTVRFIKYMKVRKYERLVLSDDHARQQALLRHLDLWSLTLDKLLVRDTITDRELDAAKTLRIHQLVATMWLKRSIVPEQCSNDESNSDYDTAVSLAESIHSIAGTPEQQETFISSSFLFDMEVVSPLYFIASNCRDPHTRRRAIAILKRGERREGLWDSTMAATVAERIMEIEEANLTTLDGSELPAEEMRVHNTRIVSDVGTNRKKHSVTFHTLPEGIDGPWKAWTEYIVLP